MKKAGLLEVNSVKRRENSEPSDLQVVDTKYEEEHQRNRTDCEKRESGHLKQHAAITGSDFQWFSNCCPLLHSMIKQSHKVTKSWRFNNGRSKEMGATVSIHSLRS